MNINMNMNMNVTTPDAHHRSRRSRKTKRPACRVTKNREERPEGRHDDERTRLFERALLDGLSKPMRRTSLPSFSIIDSTLREGEQFAYAYFDTDTKIAIARALDEFGVDYIEVTNPAASERSRRDCEAIAKLGLRAKVLAHIRCMMSDARIAVQTGVQGVNAMIGTSSLMQEFSHGRDIYKIEHESMEVVQFLKSSGLEVRFSTEDTFRSRLQDIVPLYLAMDGLGVDRIGIADTVGCASPREVYYMISLIRRFVRCDMEVHMHNDTGCAVANAFCALEAGATHIDTTVLGIGERNGITSLGAFIARLAAVDMEGISKRFQLPKLRQIEKLVAGATGMQIPFNNCITGSVAFAHKAGIHTKAILANPKTYEILDPAKFGVERQIMLASSLTGWHSMQHRSETLGYPLNEVQAKQAARQTKQEADLQMMNPARVDEIIHNLWQAQQPIF